MGMPRGLIKINAALAKGGAIRDWNRAATIAAELGLVDVALQLQPKSSFGYKRIDQRTAELKTEIRRQAVRCLEGSQLFYCHFCDGAGQIARQMFKHGPSCPIHELDTIDLSHLEEPCANS